jgi:hypothetical protein
MNNSFKPFSVSLAVLMFLFLAASSWAQSIYSNAVTSLNPVAYWPMHEIAPAAPADIETNYGSLGALGTGYYADWALNNGAPGNSSIVHQIPGPLANDPNTAAFMTDPGITATSGANTNSYLLVPHTSPLTTLQPPFTEEVWMMATNTGFGDLISQDGTALNAGNANNTYGVRVTWGAGVGYTNTATIFQVYNGITTANGYNTNTWHYVVMVCSTNATSTNYTIYVDNAFAGTAVVTSFKPDSWDPITIGAGLWQTSGLIRQTALSLDEVAIYTNALSVTAISNHWAIATNTSSVAGDYYNAVIGNNPLLYYRMDSPSYTALPPANTWPVLKNYGSTAANGVYRPGVAPGSVAGPNAGGIFYGGLSGTNAMAGNGVSAFADAGYNPAFDPTNHMPLSVTACFKGNPADSRYQNIVGHSDNSWRLAINTDGKLHFNVVPGGGNDAISSKVYNDGNWHQVVAVYDGTSNYLYLDGKLDGQTLVGTNTIPGSTNDVLLGADPQYLTINTGAGRQFAGNLCEVALFTNALSATQARTLYDSIGAPPAITQQPVSAAFGAGTSFTNTVVAGFGSGPLFYQWFTNGIPIGGATNSTLVFNSLIPANADTNYYVVVTNYVGAVTSSIVSLTVYTTPVFATAYPITYTNPITLYGGTNVNGTNFLGSTPSFSVSVFGAQPFTYQWTTNNMAVAGANGATFTFTNCQLGGPTNFSCVVANSYGSVTNTWSASYLPAPMAPFPQAVLAANPITYWRLNEPDNQVGDGNPGAICNDYQSGNNGLYTNMLLQSNGGYPDSGYSATTDPTELAALFGQLKATFSFASWFGTNIEFSGTNNASFTTAVWANGRAIAQVGNSGLMTKGFFNGEEFTIDQGAASQALRFGVRQAASPFTFIGANSTNRLAADANWHFVVGVCDEPNTNVSLYVDGRLAARVFIAKNSGLITTSAGSPIILGARSSTLLGDQQFKGYLNDAAIYGYAMSAGQIASQYVGVGGTIAPYFVPAPAANASAGVNKTLTIPVTAVGTPPIGFVWTNVTTGGSVIATGVTNGLTLNATLNYANVLASWNTNQLELIVTNAYGTANAFVTLSITNTVNQNPTNIVFSAAGGNLTLSWPQDHTGWRLLSQTNTLSVGINTNWVTVAGSTATNQVVIPINITNGSVFYRLVYP